MAREDLSVSVQRVLAANSTDSVSRSSSSAAPAPQVAPAGFVAGRRVLVRTKSSPASTVYATHTSLISCEQVHLNAPLFARPVCMDPVEDMTNVQVFSGTTMTWADAVPGQGWRSSGSYIHDKTNFYDPRSFRSTAPPSLLETAGDIEVAFERKKQLLEERER